VLLTSTGVEEGATWVLPEFGKPAFHAIGADDKPLPHTMDAVAWAQDFVKTALTNPSIATDEGTMVAWFANAIMAGYDEAQRRSSASLILLGEMSTPLDRAIRDILTEFHAATANFLQWPTDPLHALAVVQEEVGEVQKEVLQMCYEPAKSSAEKVRKEAIQMAAMSLRFLLSLDAYVYAPGAQHEQIQ